MKIAVQVVTAIDRAGQEIQSQPMVRLYVLSPNPMTRIVILHYQLTIILVQCITVVFSIGFIVRSGDEKEIGDNDGDDEVDDLGIGRKRKRLVRNKLAGNNLLI